MKRKINATVKNGKKACGPQHGRRLCGKIKMREAFVPLSGRVKVRESEERGCRGVNACGE